MQTLTQSSSVPLLRREDLNEDPIVQFGRWLGEAAAGPVSQPLAATLATVGNDGRPLARTVLLKYFDSDGFVFFTHRGSRKVRHISENSNVSLLFPWIAQNRQVNITGKAHILGAIEAVKCFLLGEADGVSTRVALAMQWDDLKHRFGASDLPQGASWAGYRVAPESIEFFQGRGPRVHDRFLYSRDAATGFWEISSID